MAKGDVEREYEDAVNAFGRWRNQVLNNPRSKVTHSFKVNVEPHCKLPFTKIVIINRINGLIKDIIRTHREITPYMEYQLFMIILSLNYKEINSIRDVACVANYFHKIGMLKHYNPDRHNHSKCSDLAKNCGIIGSFGAIGYVFTTHPTADIRGGVIVFDTSDLVEVSTVREWGPDPDPQSVYDYLANLLGAWRRVSENLAYEKSSSREIFGITRYTAELANKNAKDIVRLCHIACMARNKYNRKLNPYINYVTTKKTNLIKMSIRGKFPHFHMQSIAADIIKNNCKATATVMFGGNVDMIESYSQLIAIAVEYRRWWLYKIMYRKYNWLRTQYPGPIYEKKDGSPWVVWPFLEETTDPIIGLMMLGHFYKAFKM